MTFSDYSNYNQEDETGDQQNTMHVVFTFEIKESSSIHQRWNKIKSLGPRLSGTGYCLSGHNSHNNPDLCREQGSQWVPGKVENSPYVCSYSQNKCDGGRSCRGFSTNGVIPDEFNAIFRKDLGDGNFQCYRARAQSQIGDLKLKSKVDGPIIIYLTKTAVVDEETVEVMMMDHDEDSLLPNDQVCNGNNKHLYYKDINGKRSYVHLVKVNISGGSSSDQIASKLIGDGDADCEDGDACCLMDVENLSPGAFQNINEGLHILSLNDFYYQMVGGLFIYSETPHLSLKFSDLDANREVLQRGNLFQVQIGQDDQRNSCRLTNDINQSVNLPFIAIDLNSDLITSGEVPLSHYDSSGKYTWDEFNTFVMFQVAMK